MRRFILAFLGLVLALALAVVALILFLPADRIAALALAEFEASTGREIRFAGGIRPAFAPSPGIATGRVEMSNADWSGAGPMVSAEGVRVGVALLPLLSGEIRITGITVEKPRILLERDAEGRANWAIGEGPGAAVAGGGDAPGGGMPALVLDRIEIRDGSVTYTDHGTGQVVALTGLTLETALPGGNAPVRVVAAALLGGQPLSAAIDVAAPDTLRSGGTSGIAAALTLGQARAGLSGEATMAEGIALAGAFDLDLPDTGAVLAALGQPRPAIPYGLGQAVRLSGTLAWAGDAGTLTEAVFDLDQNRLSGDLALLTDGPRPFLTAGLATGMLDLRALRGDGDSGGASGDGGPQGWSTDPIDLGGLAAFDGEFDIRAEAVDLDSTKFGPTHIVASLREGRLDADIRRLAVYGGAVTGRVTATGQGGATVSGDLAASGVALQALFADTLDFDRITGAGDMDIRFAATGRSLDAIMHALSGTGSFAFTQGEILGLDLVAMLRNLDGAFQGAAARTIFDSITASFEIRDGVLNNVDLNFLAPLAEAIGEGTVGLGDQVLDYRVTPRLLKGEAGEGGISVPVLITGSWSNPSFRPDLKGLVDARARKELKKIEDKAKARVEKEIGLEPGESLEDRAKEELGKKLQEGLKGLLGGN